MRTRVKVCCIASNDEAAMAIAEGADAIGLVGPMPSGPGIIDLATAREIADRIEPPIATFLLTSEITAQAIIEQVASTRANTVQVVNHIDPSESEKLARSLPMVRRVQVIHVEGFEALELLPDYSPHNHAFLLDSGKPNASIAELGGTGRTHDWSISAEIVKKSTLPVFLAGGLKPENVGAAITQVRPFGVDLCSGVRTNDQLDRTKLRAFMRAVRSADQSFTES